MTATNANKASTSATQALFGTESQMAAIMKRLNAIADNPLCRNEATLLQRAYTAAVVQYFDACRAACAKSECERPAL